MGSDRSVRFFLSRLLLACALVSPSALTACGGDDTSRTVEEAGADDDAPADDDADDDVPADDDVGDDDTEPPPGDDDDGDDDTGGPTPTPDAGKPPTPGRSDAGADAGAKPDSGGTTTPKPDAGGGSDAGDDEPKTDGGGAVTPPSDGKGIMRGDAPTEMSATANGPYMVKTYTSGYMDSPAFADGTVHYPEGAEPPFAFVAVVPGFVSPQSSIRAWGPFLASHGIVTMTIGTNSGSDQPPARSRALLGALKVLEGENTRSGSPIMGKLDLTRQATMGWSMGGGGTLLAAQEKQDLKATISMCGWNPGASYARIKAPALMFAATSDPLAGGQSQGFYRSIPETVPKMLFEVQGGSHNIANSPSGHGRVIGRFGLSWMKTYLEEDPRYKQFLTKGKPSGLAAYMTNVM
jgi:hypothetical protein